MGSESLFPPRCRQQWAFSARQLRRAGSLNLKHIIHMTDWSSCLSSHSQMLKNKIKSRFLHHVREIGRFVEISSKTGSQKPQRIREATVQVCLTTNSAAGQVKSWVFTALGFGDTQIVSVFETIKKPRFAQGSEMFVLKSCPLNTHEHVSQIQGNSGSRRPQVEIAQKPVAAAKEK